MVTFCYIYHCYSTYRGLRLIDKHMDTILDNYDEIVGNNPLKVLEYQRKNMFALSIVQAISRNFIHLLLSLKMEKDENLCNMQIRIM